MPAPRWLSVLPKPILFGLYGAFGGLVGALVLAEPLYHLLAPAEGAAAEIQPQVAVVASPAVEVFVGGQNRFPVQVAREGFTGPVSIHVEDLPPGITAAPVVIAADQTEGQVTLIASPTAASVATHTAKVIATGGPESHLASAETTIPVRVLEAQQPLADVVFVLDISASMQWAIDDLKNGIGQFTEALSKARVDFRLGLVVFEDATRPNEGVNVIHFKGGPFTADTAVFREEVSQLRIKIGSGGDIPESSLEALVKACELPFRKEATKVLLLITDAPPQVSRGRPEQAVENVVVAIRESKIDAVHTVVHRLDEAIYRPLTQAGLDKDGGRYFNLADVVRGEDGFDAVLRTFGSAVTSAAIAKNPANQPRIAEKSQDVPRVVKSLQSREQTAAGSEGQTVVRSGVWTAAIAAWIGLALVAGQHHYLRGSWLSVGGICLALMGGFGVGCLGGAAGQGLYLLAKGNEALSIIFQVLGWSLLGALAGAGLSMFIPNMKWTLGLLGGALGGALGCGCYLAVSGWLSSSQLPGGVADSLGRLSGGLALGLCIGLMVTIAETVFRNAWLEIRYGARETITVTLGPEPVKIGSDAKNCTVWARGAPPVALRFFLRDGQVICDELTQGREVVASDGFQKEVGTLTVCVRTGQAAAHTTVARQQPAKGVPVATAARSESADDDGFELPLPVTPSRSSAVPASAAPVPPRTTSPVATSTAQGSPLPEKTAQPVKPAIPKIQPAIKPTVKNPNACPGCGRVIPGAPGQRYCMMCDKTF
ncbi:MAG: VWA domain-containing protein [Gemmataceae bacterium]|nr:VWA domain-containing protein [Gemmata sp.]MDW8196087.1 VWA domain-containing protein [Gemmataceae bacterium]